MRLVFSIVCTGLGVMAACSRDSQPLAAPLSAGTVAMPMAGAPVSVGAGGAVPTAGLGSMTSPPATGASGTGAAPPVSVVPAANGGAGGSGTAGMIASAAAGTPAAGSGVPPVAGSGAPNNGASGSTMVGAGTGGASGAGGMAGGEAAYRAPCLTNGSQVVVVGDSYVTYPTHSFDRDIVREAGEPYRVRGELGISMASGGLRPNGPFVPAQFDSALEEDDDIIAAIVTGGGNDVLISDSTKYPGGNDCKNDPMAADVKVCRDIVDEANQASAALMSKMAESGVKDIIYYFYPKVPGASSLSLGGSYPAAILDYSRPIARENCEKVEANTGGKMRCYFLDLAPVFDGHPEWFDSDGVHPTNQGSAAMAKAVVALMKDKCMAQRASSGCCEP